ncbi:phosphatase PAP2 family protein [Spongiactinospora sp. 9N601]|uniref:phosphatase PAP2 family protein n=1 Tax=Spongiactinospora sp. 9N601 TaxID=3375149 RepID=UPI00379D6B50
MTTPTPRSLITAGLACAAAFVLTGLLVRQMPSPLDRLLLDGIRLVPGSTLERLATVLSAIGVLAGLTLLITVAIQAWRKGTPWLPPLLSFVLLVKCGSLVTLQAVFRRPGPPAVSGTFSYPSGHATIASALAVTSIVISVMYARHLLRALIPLQGAAVVITMASRVALGEHYLTDVLGAILGTSAIALLGLAVATTRWPGRPQNARAMK